MQEVTTLEKAYHYTTNMELYSSHAQKDHHRLVLDPRNGTLTTSRLGEHSSKSSATVQPSDRHHPTLPHPPLRLLLPPPVAPTVTHATPTLDGYGTRTGYTENLQSNRSVVTPALPSKRSAEGRNPGGIRPRPAPAQSPTTNSRVVCFKCQGWGHFASQYSSQQQATRPAQALVVEIHNDEHPPPPRH